MQSNHSSRTILVATTIFFLSAGHAELLAQCEVAQVTAPAPFEVDRLGVSVFLNGDRLAVGARGDEAVYIFRRSQTGWVLEDKLQILDLESGGFFGAPVGLAGDVAVVGARFLDPGGAAVVFRFDGTSWAREQVLVPLDVSLRDYLGTSAAISLDTIVFGGTGADCIAGASCGSAYVYRYNGMSWAEEQRLVASNPFRASFGISAAIDGDRIVIGASLDEVDCGLSMCQAGAAYVFHYTGSSWVEEAKLAALEPNSGDRFGSAVSISGDRIIVGSPYDDAAAPEGTMFSSGSASVFRLDAEQWVLESTLRATDAAEGRYFGGAVQINGDTALVGTTCCNRDPLAYVFVRKPAGWSEVTKLTPSTSHNAGSFGTSVALGSTYAAVGAPYPIVSGSQTGAVFIYDLLGGPDTNLNGINDTCEGDCNANGVPDSDDIATGFSVDCDGNGTPDECEADCNSNGVVDACDISAGDSLDCAGEGVPDECEPDCNANGIADSCDILAGASADCTQNGVPDECEPDCNANGTADTCDLLRRTSSDCNQNGAPDECDISIGISLDCSTDGVPDECDPDCNINGVPDTCDVVAGTSEDIDGDQIPDECEPWSQCVSAPGFFDFGPHRVNIEAEQLAMNLTGALRAPDVEYDRIVRDLALIRSEYTETADVMDRLNYGPDGLLVAFNDGVPQDQFDALNVFYQVFSETTFLSGSRLLSFCDNLHAPVLALQYAALPEVRYAEPDWTIGDGDEVVVSLVGTDFRYNIATGYGDCPSGCICHLRWVFDVDEAGNITFLSRVEEGPCFGDCCLPDGSCVRLADEVCSQQGGTRVVVCFGDGDANGTDDACECIVAPAPALPAGSMPMNRYLDVTPDPLNLGSIVALRITPVDLPAPYDVLNGLPMWVGAPSAISEVGSVSTPPTQNGPFFWSAPVQCQPVFRDWSVEGTVYISHEAIVPGAAYEIQTIGEHCPISEEGSYSAPATVTTAMWGDVAASFDVPSQTWPAPDQSIDVTSDVISTLEKFSGRSSAPIKARVDLEPAKLDGVINITDVVYVLEAFSGRAYPFPLVSIPCP